MDIGKRKRIGHSIKVLRTRAYLTQAELAHRARLNVGTVKNYETWRIKEPTVAALERIAQVLGVGLADLWATDYPALKKRRGRYRQSTIRTLLEKAEKVEHGNLPKLP